MSNLDIIKKAAADIELASTKEDFSQLKKSVLSILEVLTNNRTGMFFRFGANVGQATSNSTWGSLKQVLIFVGWFYISGFLGSSSFFLVQLVGVVVFFGGPIYLLKKLSERNKASNETKDALLYFEEISKSIKKYKLYLDSKEKVVLSNSLKRRVSFLIGDEYEATFEGGRIKLINSLFMDKNNNVFKALLLSNSYVSRKLNVSISSQIIDRSSIPSDHVAVNNAFRLSHLNNKFHVYAKPSDVPTLPTLITPRFEEELISLIENNYFSGGLSIEIIDGDILIYNDNSNLVNYVYKDGSREKMTELFSLWPITVEDIQKSQTGDPKSMQNAAFMYGVVKLTRDSEKILRKNYDMERLMKLILSNVDDNYR